MITSSRPIPNCTRSWCCEPGPGRNCSTSTSTGCGYNRRSSGHKLKLGASHLRAVILVDEEMYDASDPDFANHVPQKYHDAEFYVSVALRKMGHRVLAIPATPDLTGLLKAIKAAKPHFVFNLVEHIGGSRPH